MRFFEQVLLIFLALLAAAAIGYSLYRSWYRRRAGQSPEEAFFQPVPERLRGSRILAVCLVVTCLLAFLLWAIHLQNRVEALEQSLSYAMSSLSDDLDRNYRELRREVTRQSEVLESVEWEFVDLDPDNGLLSIRFTVVPKVFSGETVIRILAANEELVLERQSDNRYTGTLCMDLQSEWNGSFSLSLTEGRTVKTQLLDFRLNDVRGSLLPFVSCSANCQTEGGRTLSLDATVFAEAARYSVTSMTAELVRGDELVCSKELTLSGPGDLSYPYNEVRLDLPEPLEEGSALTLRLRFEDSLGLRHESDALLIVGGEPFGLVESDVDPARCSFFWTEAIYNAAGSPLFFLTNGDG